MGDQCGGQGGGGGDGDFGATEIFFRYQILRMNFF